MVSRVPRRLAFSLPSHGLVGALLLTAGEALILSRARPFSDFYFVVVWAGYILLLDAAVYVQTGASIFVNARSHFLAMLPVSAAFWWLFEALNQVVRNWAYIGGRFTGFGFVVFASVDFATVLLAVWCSALFIHALLPPDQTGLHRNPSITLPPWAPAAMFGTGLVCVALPILWPRYFFGMVWLCLFFLLDPINYRLRRPSMLGAVEKRDWRLPLCFALGALLCGFFWEGWNYWSMPKWIYTIPYVNHLRIFEMPLLGWTGYLPFGLELFAMANFVFPLLGLSPLALSLPEGSNRAGREDMAS